MKFTKMHGAGNDFVVIEELGEQQEWSSLAVAMCDRHRGVGADGILLLMPSEVADFRMRIFNADGSEANTCGNGMRCLVKHFVETRGIDPRSRRITVETLVGVRDAWVAMNEAKVESVKMGMGKPEFRGRSIPVELEHSVSPAVDIKSMTECGVSVDGREVTLDLMSLGNPHAVHFVRSPVSEYPLEKLGTEIQQHRMFPGGVNFEVTRVIERRRVEARVWEQGVGETLACGSGACAIMVAARLHGYVSDMIEVSLPGGTLVVEWDGVGEVFLSGPAETVFTGEWPASICPKEAPTSERATPGAYIKNEVTA